MTATPKETVRARLKEKGMTQAQLAEQIGTTPAILSRTLGSPVVRSDSHWPAVLKALDLQVTVTPADASALTAAGVPYTGHAETDAVLNDHPDILDRVGRLERGESKLILLEEVAAKYGIKL